MARKVQMLAKRLFAVMIGSIAFALVIPTGAWAGSDFFGFSWNRNWGSDDHGRYDRHAGHDDHRRGYDDRHGSKKGSSKYSRDQHNDRHRYGKRDDDGRHHDSHRKYGDRAPHYFCKPCNHHFRSRSALNQHVGGRHHVPFWRLARAIAYTTLGFTFYG